jgi:hypothetical protein
LARGVLPTATKLGDANVPPPTGGGGPELAWWSEQSFQGGGRGDQTIGFATRYRKLWLSIATDQDTDYTFAWSNDGVTYGGDPGLEVSGTFTAAGTPPVAFEPRTPWLKLFLETAVTPTEWAMVLTADESEAAAGP